MTKYSIACMYICYNMWLLDYLFRTFEEIIGLILALNRLPYVHNQSIERKTDNLSVFHIIQILKLICSLNIRIFYLPNMLIFKNSEKFGLYFKVGCVFPIVIWPEFHFGSIDMATIGMTHPTLSRFCRGKSVILNTKKRIHKKPILTMR